MTTERPPEPGDKIVYISETLGALYDARVHFVHNPKSKNTSVDLVAFNPRDNDEIWKYAVPHGLNKGHWAWPQELEDVPAIGTQA